MKRQTFAWGIYRRNVLRNENWIESLYVFGLLLAAILLFCINLGSVALRDWDEAIVAQVAQEIWRAADGSLTWLFPSLPDQLYLNKPPLIHNLIALTYRWWGVNEWTTRLPCALLSACSVPLLYAVGREIFVSRLPALYAALIYLTLMPVVRHGRLAMLDGAVLCFAVLLFLCLLRSRRDLRWSLGIGLSFGLLCLTKSIMGVLILAIALGFLWWDTPRMFASIYLWIGLGLGSILPLSWYAAQWWHYGSEFWSQALVDQSLGRIWMAVEGNTGPVWYYLWELFKYSLPWLIVCGYGLRLAWDHRNWSWSKLVLVWSGVYFVVVSVMVTKLPWYILPVYPALALAGGAYLYHLKNLPSQIDYPRFWVFLFADLAILTTIGAIGFGFGFGVPQDSILTLLIASVALTLGMTTLLVARRDEQFIPVLFWGMYVSVLLFVSSPVWNWELNERYPVKDVAVLIKQNVPAQTIVYTSDDEIRRSLNFYSDRTVKPATDEELQSYWQNLPEPYLLVESDILEQLELAEVETLGTAFPQWILISKAKEL